MAKKKKKVKKKNVKSNKKVKKTKKGKSAKKKIARKKKKKTKTKKVSKTKKTKKKKSDKKTKKKKRRKKKITMEDFYCIVNKVQMKKKNVTFCVALDESQVIENIVKDLRLEYSKVEMKTQVIFTLSPTLEEKSYEMLKIEYLDDEIVEEGQIFP